MLARLVGEVVPRRLLPGNQVQALINGDCAFREMIAAIDRAVRSITLATCILTAARRANSY